MAKQLSSNNTKRVYLGREVWVKHVSTYHESDLSQSAYAKKANINLTTFSNWISKLRREQQSLPTSSLAFVPVNIAPDTNSSVKAKTRDTK